MSTAPAKLEADRLSYTAGGELIIRGIDLTVTTALTIRML